MGKSMLYLASAAALTSGVTAELFAMPEATTTINIPLAALQDYPRPTKGPSAEALRMRQATSSSALSILVAPDNTCGYIDGRSDAPFECLDPTFTCMFFTANDDFYGNVACCNPETCGVRATCYDYDAVFSSTVCDDDCMTNDFVLKCTNSAAPFCHTVSFTSDILDFWCVTEENSSTQRAFTTYPGQTGRRWLTVAQEDEEEIDTKLDDFLDFESATTGTTDSTTTTSTDDGAGSATASNDASNAGDSDNSDSDDGGSSTPIGPIVGGVVGGIALIAAIAFGIWFIRRKKQKDQAAAAAAGAAGAPPVAQVQQPPPHGPYSPPPPGFMGGPTPPPDGTQAYYDPSKGPYVQSFQQSPSPPGYPPQQPQYQYSPQQQPQQNLAPGGYYPAGAVPDRADTTSPSAVSSMHRLSTVPDTPASYNTQQFAGAGGYAPQGAPQGPPQPGQPTIYEAPATNEGHHKGQMHELA